MIAQNGGVLAVLMLYRFEGVKFMKLRKSNVTELYEIRVSPSGQSGKYTGADAIGISYTY